MPAKIRLPAEWEPHRATWLAWPSNVDNWHGKMETVAWAFTEIARVLTSKQARGEKVCFTVNTPTEREIATEKLRAAQVDLAQIEFYQFPTFWGWLRDCGPQFIKRTVVRGDKTFDEQLEVVDFHFNAWANYDNWESDDKIPERIARQFNLPLTVAVDNSVGKRWVLEGGALDVNGAGTLLTTAECWLDQTVQVRNEGKSPADHAELLAQYLGIKKILWLRNGLSGDDTHGHVDDICRFVKPHTVVAAYENQAQDANYCALAENWEILNAATTAEGEKLNVIKLPMPRAVYYGSERLPASYANFYIGNAAVIVPTFNDPQDYYALGILRELFPEREVVGIHALDLVAGGGSLHCLTMQEPK